MVDQTTEKTEQPSERRLQQSREKGQVSRSREYSTFMLLIVGLFVITISAHKISMQLQDVYETQFSFTRAIIFDDKVIIKVLIDTLKKVLYILAPLCFTLIVTIIISGFMVGGFNFSWQACAIKFERLNPISGLQKIFSTKTVIELIKSILKFALLALVFYAIVHNFGLKYFALDNMETIPGIITSLKLTEKNLYFLVGSLIVVVLIDVPYQIYQLQQELKMTKQEVKDEQKDTDGNPQVKAKLRKLQNDMRRRNMMAAIPTADVIITNPEHYAVAISYKEDLTPAPVVVAKGMDYIAALIKQVAIANNIPIVEAPPVARSLYYHVDLEENIPSGLYIAVARILTFVHELNLFKQGKIKRPKLKEEYAIPTELVK